MTEIRERYFSPFIPFGMHQKNNKQFKFFSFLFLPPTLWHASFTFWQKKSRNFLKQILNTSCLSSLCKH